MDDSINYKNVTIQYKVTQAASPSASTDTRRQLLLELSVPSIKHETPGQEKSQHNYSTNQLEQTKSIEYVNYYDNEFVIDSIKLEVSDSDLNVINSEKEEDQAISCVVEDTSVPYDMLVTTEPVECTLCHRIFINRFYLFKHNIEHLKVDISTSITLDTCKSINISKLVNDITHLPEECREYECQYCKRLFKRYMRWREHMTHAHKINQYVYCDTCGRQFESIGHVRKHIESRHMLDKNSKHIKNDRNNRNKDLENLNFSVKYKCNICDTKFISTQYLKVHLKQVHSKEKWKCKMCEKIFKNRQYLSQHLKLHWNERYKCELCDAEFKTKQNLSRHIRIIHYKMEMKCEYCDVVFKNKKYLLTHVKSDHSDKAFVCKYCGASFKRKRFLTIHLENVHSDVKLYTQLRRLH